MKKLLYLVGICSVTLFSSCGGGDEKVEEVKIDVPQGMIQYDLSSHGIPLVCVIPDTVDQPVEVNVKDWGETTVAVGKYFQIQIAEGGDMSLRKKDLAEDLLYKATYITETPEAILYKQEIPDGGIKPAYHFYFVTTINGNQYEIEDVKGDEFYNEKAADRMLQAAKMIVAAQKES